MYSFNQGSYYVCNTIETRHGVTNINYNLAHSTVTILTNKQIIRTIKIWERHDFFSVLNVNTIKSLIQDKTLMNAYPGLHKTIVKVLGLVGARRQS